MWFGPAVCWLLVTRYSLLVACEINAVTLTAVTSLLLPLFESEANENRRELNIIYFTCLNFILNYNLTKTTTLTTRLDLSPLTTPSLILHLFLIPGNRQKVSRLPPRNPSAFSLLFSFTHRPTLQHISGMTCCCATGPSRSSPLTDTEYQSLTRDNQLATYLLEPADHRNLFPNNTLIQNHSE
jgi:hypothetical protein